MAETVTVGLSEGTLARASAAAQAEGLSLSEWLERAARREILREASRQQDEWLAANPEVCDELDGFDRLADRLEGGWSDLAEAA